MLIKDRKIKTIILTKYVIHNKHQTQLRGRRLKRLLLVNMSMTQFIIIMYYSKDQISYPVCILLMIQNQNKMK